MYSEIADNLAKQLPNSEYQKLQNKTWHLGIFTEPRLSYMMNHKKTIESRFSKNKISPYNRITRDDIVIIKKSGGEVLGYFTIKKITFYDLTVTDILSIKDKYEKELCVAEEFWGLKKNSQYATLIEIDSIVKLEPFKINKKGMQTWIILN